METTKLRLKKHAEEQCKILNKKGVSYNFSINDEVLVRNPITTETSLRNEGPFRVRQISDNGRQILRLQQSCNLGFHKSTCPTA